jgi:hypothetical protein
MAKIGDFFYVVLAGNMVHRIADIRSAANPADAELKEYVAGCGEIGKSDILPGSPPTVVKETLENIPKTRRLCPKCFSSREIKTDPRFSGQ